MNSPFRIEKKDSFNVIGYVLHTTNQRKEGMKLIPKQWQRFENEQLQEVLMPLMNKEPYGVFGISVYNVDIKDSRKFDHYIAVTSDIDENEELETYHVPAHTWAVFPCTIETINKTEVNAITKYLPKSNYRPLNKGYLLGRMKSQAPDITYYGKDGEIEVWVAVKEK